ncbi:putative ubiquitin carboxyl-terminal hydrolase isozyme L3 [Triangularia verruculosa]|uniref:Ubiquitin carboxyl-terminal hydrolase n=1 Tax=Triangularia verruculosa TaxID=2587418 RepID=A0AAN7B0R5_9PEZI|nr:putative ubiquitin carboxyl-terminal hydrolase isozyme L3 [Triangularia verruculosa]
MSNPDPPASAPAFIPLEANPELMTTLLRNLGMSSHLALHDVYSLTDPDLLSFIPRPAHALLLVFPITPTYESHRLAEDSLVPVHSPTPDFPVIWFPQTIRNACGLIALLHAVSNGDATDFIESGSDLDRIVKTAIGLDVEGRGRLLEREEALARAHRAAAEQGDTAAPRAEEEVDLHYVAFVKGRDGGLWELDGRRKGPIRRGGLEQGEDVLSEKGLVVGARKFLEREGGDLRFSAVALAGSYD